MTIELDATLAQQIVERTMQIIDYNINVMDAQGRIIASGDATRIGQVHDGALLAIAKGDMVALDATTAPRLNGARPGVNLVLSHQFRFVGVIGLTGDPREVQQFGQLVKMAAELIIEQSQAWQQRQWGYRQQEEFIVQWLQGDTDWPVLRDWARRLHIDLDRPRVAVLIEVSGGESPRQQAMREVIEQLERRGCDNLVAMVSLNELVVLKPLPQGNEKREWGIEHLLARADSVTDVKLRVAVGQHFASPKRMPDSFQVARQTLEMGKRRDPERRLFFFQDAPLPVLLSQFECDWRQDVLLEPIRQLVKMDPQGKLLKTLRRYFAEFPDQQRCADRLHIHRNTLRYRLRQIEEATGCRLDDLDSLTRLYIADALL